MSNITPGRRIDLILTHLPGKNPVGSILKVSFESWIKNSLQRQVF